MGPMTRKEWVAAGGTDNTAPHRLSMPDRLDGAMPALVSLANKEAKMAMTSLSLGPHWEDFLAREIASGRYASTSEVLRAALQALEERGLRVKALQDHLAEGAAQARREEFTEFSLPDVLQRAKARAAKGDLA